MRAGLGLAISNRMQTDWKRLNRFAKNLIAISLKLYHAGARVTQRRQILALA
jgi:hypothetical protein